MSVVGRIGRGLLRTVASQVAARAAQAELFEKPGERTAQPPIFAAESAAGGSPEEPVAPAAAPQPEAAPAGAAAASLTNIDALKAHLAGLEGLTVVNHWATWCIPCIEEFGHLKALQERLGDRARFLGVSWDLFDPRGDEDDIREHVENFGTGHSLGWPSLVLDESVDAEAFFEAFSLDFHQIPQTWFVAPGGAVLHRVDGVITADDLDELVALVETLRAS